MPTKSSKVYSKSLANRGSIRQAMLMVLVLTVKLQQVNGCQVRRDQSLSRSGKRRHSYLNTSWRIHKFLSLSKPFSLKTFISTMILIWKIQIWKVDQRPRVKNHQLCKSPQPNNLKGMLLLQLQLLTLAKSVYQKRLVITIDKFRVYTISLIRRIVLYRKRSQP